MLSSWSFWPAIHSGIACRRSIRPTFIQSLSPALSRRLQQRSRAHDQRVGSRSGACFKRLRLLFLIGLVMLAGCAENARLADAEQAAATWKLVAALALGAGAVIGILLAGTGSDGR